MLVQSAKCRRAAAAQVTIPWLQQVETDNSEDDETTITLTSGMTFGAALFCRMWITSVDSSSFSYSSSSSSSSLMALQSKAAFCLLDALLPVSFVFDLSFQICNFAFITISQCQYIQQQELNTRCFLFCDIAKPPPPPKPRLSLIASTPDFIACFPTSILREAPSSYHHCILTLRRVTCCPLTLSHRLTSGPRLYFRRCVKLIKKNYNFIVINLT
jgi:hypothetical protein